MITLPNILTFIRIIGIISFIVLFFFEKIWLSVIVLFLSAMTDILDGLLARILKQESDFGSFLDPFADKLLVVVTTIILATRNYIPWWLFLIIFIRDILIVIGWFLIKNQNFSSLKTEPKFSGKTAVFFQMLTLIIVITSLAKNSYFFIIIKPIFFIITAFLSIISLLDYILSFKNFYSNKKH